MRQWLALTLPLSLLFTACSDDPEIIDNDQSGIYAGSHATEGVLPYFPTDTLTVEDDTTFTGLRVNVDLRSDPELRGGPRTLTGTEEFLNQLDGFGTSAGGWIRFSEPIDADTVREANNTFIGYFEGNTPVIVPTEIVIYGDSLLFRPDLPLPGNHEAFMMTSVGIESREGDSFTATPELQAALKDGSSDTNEAYAQRLQTAAQKIVDGNILNSVDEITSFSLFTTQSLHETDIEVAERIRTIEPTITIADDACEDLPADNLRRCYFHIEIANFTNPDNTISDNAAEMDERYVMQATLFLPRVEDFDSLDIPYEPEVGFPVAIFGHGLTSDAHQGIQIARHAAPLGVATIGFDSPQHGTHPMRNAQDGAELDVLIDLFGIQTVGGATVHAFKLRDGWRQSVFDKLGLVEAIKQGIDADQDGYIDLDSSRMSYLGASLGAIQGSEFLALTNDIDLAMFSVGGARITDIIRFSDTFKLLHPLIFPRSPSQSIVLRTLILLQTAVERGDGMNWAPHVMQNRLVGDNVPDFAMQVSVPDAIVPPETGINLTRALGLPIIGTPIRPERGIELAGPPTINNHASGKTVGVLQMDYMHRGDNPDWVPSTHDKSPDSFEAIQYWKQVFVSKYRDGQTRLIDPYTEPGVTPRPGY